MYLTQREIGRSRTASGAALTILIGAAVVIIVCSSVFSQTDSAEGRSAAEVLRKAINSELKAQSDDHSRWMYQEKTRDAGNHEEVKWIVETGEGDLDRLWSKNGWPIPREQQAQEDQRIANLLHNPDRRRKRQSAQQEDANQTERLFRMLPDAVTARFGEHQGSLVEILFKPNPNFRPSSHEAAVFHGMEGRIWIDENESRLAEIEGHLIRPVKFYSGLLGHLDEGGTFHVKQSKIAPGHWEITLLHVNMRGRALFFKTISVQQNSIRSDFQPVPANITLAQAAEELQRQCKTQATANNGSHSAEQGTSSSKARP